MEVIKISLFLTTAPLKKHTYVKWNLCHLVVVSFTAKCSSFLHLVLRRYVCGFQTFPSPCSFMSADMSLFVNAWSLPVLRTQQSTLCDHSSVEASGPFLLTGHHSLKNSASKAALGFLSATSLAHVGFAFYIWWF